MKKTTFLCFLLMLFFTNAGAQVRYKDGYFIDKGDKTTKCLILDLDWLNNPSEVKYRLEGNSEVRSFAISDVKEFGVDGSRFVYAEVPVDTSRRGTKNLTNNRIPEWKIMRMFLRVLVEGKASLFEYRNSEIERFFYSVDGSPIEQLVYKEFLNAPEQRQLSSAPITIGRNRMYIQQLKDQVLCGDVSDDELRRVDYKRDDLVSHFRKFNICHGGEQLFRVRKKSINVFLTPGFDFGGFLLSDGNNFEREFDNAAAFRLGLMGEYVLPFNNAKWSLIAEPTYQSYEANDVVTYQSVELPLGVRHSFFVGESSRIFINACLVIDFPLKYDVQFSQNSTWTSDATSASLAAGAGVNMGRFSLEGRRYFKRSSLGGGQLGNYFFVYDKFSGVVGFKLNK